jgi:hypothetical protein
MPRLLKSIFITFFLLLFCSVFVFAEEITITTYYPSPYGSYNYLQTDKLGVGDNNGDGSFSSSDVPTTSGNVWVANKVGIGTTSPSAYLHLKAGTATASTAPLKLTSGTFLTTAETGALEYSGNVLSFTPASYSRGTVPAMMWASPASAVALTSTSSNQGVLGADYDWFALSASTTYRFHAQYCIGTGATSHTIAVGFPESNSLASIRYSVIGWNVATNTTITATQISTTALTVVTAGTTSTISLLIIDGVLRTDSETSINPMIKFSAAPGGTCQLYENSYFEIWPIGTSSTQFSGRWA